LSSPEPIERPTSRRPFSWARHLPFAVLLALAAALLAAFTARHGLAGFDDDSFSYLTLARWIERGDSGVEGWAWQHAHFPPLFPLLLVLARATHDLLLAHLVVAACAALALVALYRFGMAEAGGVTAAGLLVLCWLLTPTAWVSALGILTEPLFLALTLGTLAYYARLEHRADASLRAWMVLGLWLAAVLETRSAGAALLAAFALHFLLRARRAPAGARWRPFVAFVPPLAAAIAWACVRPGGGEYGDQAFQFAAQWRAHPLASLALAGGLLWEGWLESFRLDANVPWLPAALLALLAVAAIAGAVLRAARNRVDGWYVLASVAMLAFWTFGEGTTRRLLYPLVPLALFHAGGAVAALARRIAGARQARKAVALAAVVVLAAVLPATARVAQRGFARAAFPGSSVAYADMTEFYRHMDELAATRAASRHVAAMIGLEALAYVTEPGARAMWMRPEYVSLLGQREGVPYEYAWDAPTLARALRASGARYLVLSEIYKLDVTLALSDPSPMLRDVERFADPFYEVRLPHVPRAQFVLERIDPARLDAYLAQVGEHGR
jgi:hypothetical protein